MLLIKMWKYKGAEDFLTVAFVYASSL